MTGRRTLGELKGIANKLGINKESYPNWYNIPGIRFIYRGDYSDPEIEYKGIRFNSCIVEDTMWERFIEETTFVPAKNAFAAFMREHAEDVYELCSLAVV